ncbi:MAG TPA: RluA family pseudouridine synthase [Fusibacter sp.]|nr:RluA family pseudouridine synthase [Fusibacter sp.]
MFINKESLRLDYEVEAQDAGLKIIDVLATSMNISSRLIRKCKNNNNIWLNKKSGSVNRIVQSGDIISMMLDHDENTFEPNAINVSVLYEDGDILVVDKPPFLVVHPTKGHPEGTLANALSHHQYQIGQNYKIRFINRLDRDTSGIVLIAKNAFAQQIVSEQMQANEVDKFYLAIVEGEMKDDKGTINLPIDREAELDIKRIVIETGLASITHYEVLERFKGFTYIKISLETGRTHQIRVHLSHIGHAILGDHLYGQKSDLIDRQALHCQVMSFKPPREKDKVSVVCNLPDDIENVLAKLRKDTPSD